METRTEHDALGTMEVPADAYYGIQTLRAVRNFPVSGMRAHPQLIRATALVKRAAAEANMTVGDLDHRLGNAIVQAAQEIVDGGLHDQFVVDVYQAGAGTSQNMNANEVIANRAVEILGGERGDYSLVHPNDHVNMAQSTNDTVPTAMRIAALWMLRPLQDVLRDLIDTLATKGREFDDIVKAGRTHLQDAVPVRLGQEFDAYAASLRKDHWRLERAAEALTELNLGGTAAGTGVNAHPDYRMVAVQRLSQLSGLGLRPGSNLLALMQSMTDFAHVSGALKLLSLDLIRIANDVRLLSSGPKTGLAEITLPAVQPGSSIMPGKVNPVMAEMLDMVAFQVVGNDATIGLATQAGQLELNVMMPVIAHNLLQSIEILTNAMRAFTERCVRGITANRVRCREYLERSTGLATVLTPALGYEQAAEVAKEAARTGKTVSEVLVTRGLFSQDELEIIFDDYRPLTEPGRLALQQERR
jgi:aspartate ammonia-lyase